MKIFRIHHIFFSLFSLLSVNSCVNDIQDDNKNISFSGKEILLDTYINNISDNQAFFNSEQACVISEFIYGF